MAAALYGKPPEAVETLIEVMGLQSCANTKIGNVFLKGVSGGQMRRVSIAEQLITNPDLLLLDEPTSGLDSSSAFALISHLKHLAQDQGKGILATIHQPSSQIWACFDKVCFMTEGKVMYFGPTQDVISHFERVADQMCPANTNPADFVLAFTNKDFEGHADIDKLADTWMSCVEERMAQRVLKVVNHSSSSCTPHSAGFTTRLCALLSRDFKELVRDPGVIYIRLFMYSMLSLLIGLMFFDLGNEHDDAAVMARTGVLFYLAAFMVFMSIAALPFFMLQREIFVKERCNGSYGVFEYVLSKWVVSVPGLALLALCSSLITVFMCGLNGFGTYLLDLFLSLLFAEGFMYTMAAIVPHYIIGMALGAGIFGFFMLCQGFLKIKSEIPDYLIWGHYMAPHTYTFRVFMYNEFRDIGALSSGIYGTGNDVLKFYDMEDTDVTTDLVVIAGFALLFQFFFGTALFYLHNGKR